MPLSPFDTGTDTYSASIMMDASTVRDTTVTVAVHVPREREPAILDSIYAYGAALGFKPFYDKANEYEYGTRKEFTEALIEDFHPHIAAFGHRQQYGGNENTQQIEAVHSAIHVHDRLGASSEHPVVIVDGNEPQARPLIRALSGLRDELPAVAHCQQSELYYPPALLADLVSNYLAHRVERSGFQGVTDNSEVAVPRAKQERGADWGRAISTLYQDGIEYDPAGLRTLRGDSVRERVSCWYRGAVAPNAGVDRPMSDSVTPVVNALARNGYEELAQTLREL
jgi:hypothetical protein